MSADPAEPADGAPRLTALPIATVVALLRRAGARHLDTDTVRADLAAGAPANADGTINLISYGAWLVRELARTESDHGS